MLSLSEQQISYIIMRNANGQSVDLGTSLNRFL
jgi:hypothetical protein